MTALILTDGAPQWTIPTGAHVNVFGTNGQDALAFSTGANALLDGSFSAGEDTIYIQADSTDFTVSNSGVTVTLTDALGNTIVLPAGITGQTLIFGDGALVLMVDPENSAVMLGDQTVSDTATDVTATVDPSQTSDEQFAGTTTSPPLAADDTFAEITNEESVLIDVLDNDMDADEDDLFISDITIDPATGTAVVEDGQIRFTPAEGFTGDVSFTYTVSDGTYTDTADVTGTVVTGSDPYTNVEIEAGAANAGTEGVAERFIYEVDSSTGAVLSAEGADIELTGFTIGEDLLVFEDVEAGTTTTETFTDDVVVSASQIGKLTDIVFDEDNTGHGYMLTLIGIVDGDLSDVDFSVV